MTRNIVVLIIIVLVNLGKASAFLPNPTLMNISDNIALDLGPYTCTPPVGEKQCEFITDYSGFVYNKHHHQMLMFGGGHAATFRDDIDVFDFVTLTWQSAYTPTPCRDLTTANLDVDRGAWKTTQHPFSRHTYDLLAVTEDPSHLLILRHGGGHGGCATGPVWYPAGRVAHYDLRSHAWSYGASMAKAWSNLGAAEYDPLSGLVVLVDEQNLWTYDPVRRVAKLRLSHNQSDMGYANNLVYYPPNDKMYYIARGTPTKVFELRCTAATGPPL